MNRVHRALATFIAVHVAVYLYGAFIASTLDYSKWGGPDRAFAVFVAAVVGTAGASIVYGRPR
jgi:xanthine/uracil/vitamin C permease (AzgA family)